MLSTYNNKQAFDFFSRSCSVSSINSSYHKQAMKKKKKQISGFQEGLKICQQGVGLDFPTHRNHLLTHCSKCINLSICTVTLLSCSPHHCRTKYYSSCVCVVSLCSRVWLFATLSTIAQQAPLSM